ncbi:MAG: hypothetical protein Q8P57_01520 [Candidatus Pacearchaeota archaeon]|nr:hypothetical protein [Candidatus Pacearchaeota archaeon]
MAQTKTSRPKKKKGVKKAGLAGSKAGKSKTRHPKSKGKNVCDFC